MSALLTALKARFNRMRCIVNLTAQCTGSTNQSLYLTAQPTNRPPRCKWCNCGNNRNSKLNLTDKYLCAIYVVQIALHINTGHRLKIFSSTAFTPCSVELSAPSWPVRFVILSLLNEIYFSYFFLIVHSIQCPDHYTLPSMVSWLSNYQN